MLRIIPITLDTFVLFDIKQLFVDYTRVKIDTEQIAQYSIITCIVLIH